MTYLPTRAEALARQLHADQTDKRGRPYVKHLEAVVAILLRRWPDAPEEAVAAAWLHDAVEDAGATCGKLLALGVSMGAVKIVFQVSRYKIPYQRYINHLAASGSLWAIRIKLADLEHNSDPTRAIPGSDIVERRYAPARAVLERALEGMGS